MSDKLRQQLIQKFGETGWGDDLPGPADDENISWLAADDPRMGEKHQPIEKTIEKLAELGVTIFVSKENTK